jgi:hypothetical protein
MGHANLLMTALNQFPKLNRSSESVFTRLFARQLSDSLSLIQNSILRIPIHFTSIPKLGAW